MRFVILSITCAALCAGPIVARADQAEVDALVRQLRPRSSSAPVTMERGIPQPRPQTPAAAAITPAATADRPSVSRNIVFATGSAELTPAAVRQLRDLGAALTHQVMGNSRFLIEGHTDTVGDRAMNQALSERRAEAVAAFLISQFGMAPERLVTRGKGKDELAVPTPDNTPEPRNRRVLIVNLDG